MCKNYGKRKMSFSIFTLSYMDKRKNAETLDVSFIVLHLCMKCEMMCVIL
jgi:hypothetical protein